MDDERSKFSPRKRKHTCAEIAENQKLKLVVAIGRCKGSRREFIGNRGLKVAVKCRNKENPMKCYKCINNNRVTRERGGQLMDNGHFVPGVRGSKQRTK